jgi:hypothetical protein
MSEVNKSNFLQSFVEDEISTSSSKSESKTEKEKKHSKDKKEKNKLKTGNESDSPLTKQKSGPLAIKKDNKKSERSDSSEHSKDPLRRASLAVISTTTSGTVPRTNKLEFHKQ